MEISQESPWLLLTLASVCGLLAGTLASRWALKLVPTPSPHSPNSAPHTPCTTCMALSTLSVPKLRATSCLMCGRRIPRWPVPVALLAAATFAAFTWLLVFLRCQSVAEVQPAGPLYLHRLPFHFLLLFLLLTAILTDLLDYSIPDAITLPGTLLAVLLAFTSGDLQMIHIWVNWDYELVSIYGPWLPQWMRDHQHLHGLAWSLAGMAAGASVTEIIRSLAHKILGFHALGFGDVTLMAMIGAFIGWQPVLCTLAIAPLAGIAIGLPAFILSRRSFIAFGPCLCLAAIIVICSWRQLWEGQKLRIIFSHWPTVASLLAGSLAAYTLLLLALRWFRTTPPESLRH